ncbi:hypothetical protein BDP27DRAFT_1365775 [Rhodocollybia butyracea]|uniref:Uncharacterized protein n=1 Tax=Rhodocollybia butyracea TaxID=206335 RepID=A0A9P5PMV1_9AGAR|nr:hypothetical protein BDP27DRAFT_1365775 [Rhodocollybia butyracea]
MYIVHILSCYVRFSPVKILAAPSGGDKFPVSKIPGRLQNERNNNYVWYTLPVQIGGQVVPHGQLNNTVPCNIPDKEFWGDIRSRSILIALITPCSWRKGAAAEVVEYSRMNAQIAS